MPVRSINVTVTSRTQGKSYVKSYKHDDGKVYEVPLYVVSVRGTDDQGQPVSREFRAIRFAVKRDSLSDAASTVGLAESQQYVVPQWLPDYVLHSTQTAEVGAWQVSGNYLIHDGPDDPLDATNLYGGYGCIEIADGPLGFDKFNDFILSISGATNTTRKEKLLAVGASGKLRIVYEEAARPPVKLKQL